LIARVSESLRFWTGAFSLPEPTPAQAQSAIGFGSARLRAHAAYVHMQPTCTCADWATRTAVDLLKRVKELLQLGLPRREQLEPMLLAPRSFLEYRSRLCD
jgi:hypothetical protein